MFAYTIPEAMSIIESKEHPLDVDEEATEHQEGPQGRPRTVLPSQEVMPLRKTLVERPEQGTAIDGGYIAPHYYDCFNYSLLGDNAGAVNVAVGVTSASPQEGKTLVACNLAISLTVAYQKRTIIVDLNLREPNIHRIFGIPAGPGLLEAMGDTTVQVASTSVKGLHLLTAGSSAGRMMTDHEFKRKRNGFRLSAAETSLQLAQIAAFRNVLYSLKEYFDFVIVDLPSLHDHELPLLFTNQLDGVLFVVQGGKTKQMDIDRSLQMLNEHRVIGFVYNRIETNGARNGRRQ